MKKKGTPNRVAGPASSFPVPTAEDEDYEYDFPDDEEFSVGVKSVSSIGSFATQSTGMTKEHLRADKKLREIEEKLSEVRALQEKLSMNKKKFRKFPPKKKLPRPKLRLHHPHLDICLGEIVYSPYNIPLDVPYPKETFVMAKELRNLRASKMKINDLEVAPYDVKETKKRFMEEIYNFKPTYIGSRVEPSVSGEMSSTHLHSSRYEDADFDVDVDVDVDGGDSCNGSFGGSSFKSGEGSGSVPYQTSLRSLRLDKQKAYKKNGKKSNGKSPGKKARPGGKKGVPRRLPPLGSSSDSHMSSSLMQQDQQSQSQYQSYEEEEEVDLSFLDVPTANVKPFEIKLTLNGQEEDDNDMNMNMNMNMNINDKTEKKNKKGEHAKMKSKSNSIQDNNKSTTTTDAKKLNDMNADEQLDTYDGEEEEEGEDNIYNNDDFEADMDMSGLFAEDSILLGPMRVVNLNITNTDTPNNNASFKTNNSSSSSSSSSSSRGSRKYSSNSESMEGRRSNRTGGSESRKSRDAKKGGGFKNNDDFVFEDESLSTNQSHETMGKSNSTTATIEQVLAVQVNSEDIVKEANSDIKHSNNEIYHNHNDNDSGNHNDNEINGNEDEVANAKSELESIARYSARPTSRLGGSRQSSREASIAAIAISSREGMESRGGGGVSNSFGNTNAASEGGGIAYAGDSNGRSSPIPLVESTEPRGSPSPLTIVTTPSMSSNEEEPSNLSQPIPSLHSSLSLALPSSLPSSSSSPPSPSSPSSSSSSPSSSLKNNNNSSFSPMRRGSDSGSSSPKSLSPLILSTLSTSSTSESNNNNNNNTSSSPSPLTVGSVKYDPTGEVLNDTTDKDVNNFNVNVSESVERSSDVELQTSMSRLEIGETMDDSFTVNAKE